MGVDALCKHTLTGRRRVKAIRADISGKVDGAYKNLFKLLFREPVASA